MIAETTKNNWRALGIHFALSIIGFISFVSLSLFTYSIFPDIQGVPYWAELPLFLTPIIGGSFIYIYCGYRFLKPNEKDPLLSVWLLTTVTILAGAIAMIGFLRTGIMDASSAHVLVFANTLDFVILSLFTMESEFNTFNILLLSLILLVSLLPSGLLYLGLRLRIHRETKVAAMAESSEE